MAKGKGWDGWSMEKVEQLRNDGKIKGFTVIGAGQDPAAPEVKKSKRPKYAAEKVYWEGERFDSKKEYNRYRELLLILKQGIIGQLRRQVAYELNEGGTHCLKYIADFVYVDMQTGQEIVEDAKGYRTKEYLKKRRLMKQVHGITIKES